MVNEDIVTALKNSVERGDSLENSINIMISSGYSVNDVQEASKFVGFVPMSPNKNISLIMPEQKSLFSRTPNKDSVNSQPIIYSAAPKLLTLPTQTLNSMPPRAPQQQQIQQIPYQAPRYTIAQQLPQRTSSSQELKREISPFAPKPVQVPTPVITQIPPSQQVSQMAPEKPSYKKEIILLIILLILIGILIATFLFRDKILAFFS